MSIINNCKQCLKALYSSSCPSDKSRSSFQKCRKIRGWYISIIKMSWTNTPSEPAQTMQHHSEIIPIDPALLPSPSPVPSNRSISAISPHSQFYLAPSASSSVPQSLSEWESAAEEGEYQQLKNQVQRLQATIERQEKKIEYLEARSDRFEAILKRLAGENGIDFENEMEIRPAKKLKMNDLDDRILTRIKRNDLTQPQKDVRSELLVSSPLMFTLSWLKMCRDVSMRNFVNFQGHL